MPQTMLLDTHAFIWFVAGKLRSDVAERLIGAARKRQLFVSAVSAWEIGLLGAKAGSDVPKLLPNPAHWFSTALLRTGIVETTFDSAIALSSTSLPGEFHRDPADRFLVATARALNAPLVTRDQRILDYAAAGHVQAIPC